MLKHIWSVLCKESVIQQDNVLSLRDILENVNVNVQPVDGSAHRILYPMNLPFNYEIVSYFEKDSLDAEEADIRVTTINPDGSEGFQFEQHMSVPPENNAFRALLRIQGITIKEPGRHHFRISAKSTGDADFSVVAEIPLMINVSPSEN